MKGKIIYLILTGILLANGFGLQAQELPAYNAAEPFHIYSKQMDAYYEKNGRSAPGYKQWKRIQWYQETRLGSDGTIPDASFLKQKAIEKVAGYAAQLRTSGAQLYNANWSFLGPTTVTSSDQGIGRVNRLTYHPTDVNTFFASTAGGGLWKTTNGGSNWSCLTDGLPNINTSGLVIDKNNPNIMYLLTGDGDATFSGATGCCGFGLRSSGVYKTFDGGTTWYRTGLDKHVSQGFFAYNIKMHPSNSDTLYVASSAGLYRSSDAGMNWILLFSDARVYDVEFRPGNPSVVYFSTPTSIYTRFSDQNIVQNILSNDEPGRVELAVTNQDPQLVYAVAGPALSIGQFKGVFRSVNGGANFSKTTGTPNILGRDLYGFDAEDQSGYDLTITINPLNKQHIIVGGIYLWESVNGGVNFSRINPSNYHADIHDISYHPLQPTLQYHCSDGGVYRFNTITSVWTALNNGLHITQYYRISTAQTNQVQFTGGTQDNGTHFSSLGTPVMERVIGGDGMDNIIAPTNASIIYGSSQDGIIYKSNNNGSSFYNILNKSEQENFNLQPLWLTHLALHPTDNNTIFVGTFPIVRIFQSGGVKSITELNATARAGRALVVAPTDPGRLYAASSWTFANESTGTRAWRTSDGGSSWDMVRNDTNRIITSVATNPDNKQEVYLTYGGYEDGFKVLRSTDGGDSWVNITGSLPNVPVNTIVYHDTNGSVPGALYIGTDIGVFYRNNNLGDWIPYNMGLPVAEVTDLEIQYTSGMLRAGTYGRGIWQTPLFSNSCALSLNFTANSHLPSTPYFYQASNSITSTAQLKGVGANVFYRAGNSVVLQPGFYANAVTDATFSASIGSCNNGGVPPGFRVMSPGSAAGFNGLKGYLVQ